MLRTIHFEAVDIKGFGLIIDLEKYKEMTAATLVLVCKRPMLGNGKQRLTASLDSAMAGGALGIIVNWL
ncbi:MAG: hypothetical protein KA524_03600 [Nitrosomonas sp.]|nr:hypothetical protein [Nitrosomonas sp.]MBP6075291.1 hypothetical protein [Nitrosomonas sp.]